MIDLRNRDLPNAIEVNGKSFLLKTDFREWLKFSEIIQNTDVKFGDLFFLFDGDIPQVPFIDELLKFFYNENATPKKESGESERIIDYILDGEYIVASFQQAYNIDLTACNMHWHRFKALLFGLPSETKIMEIIQMRSWKKDNSKSDDIHKELRQQWELPKRENPQEKKILDEINEEFYNC